ncbi:MAG: hypothetical protein ABJB10_09235, partial [Mesorhizobium sp.]
TQNQVARSANLTCAASLHCEMAHSSRQATSIARKDDLRIQSSDLLAVLSGLSSARPCGQERTIAFVESQAINGSASSAFI